MHGVEDCLRQVMAIRGTLGASLIDYTSGLAVGSAGRGASGHPPATAAGATKLVQATVGNAAFASAGQPGHVDDIVVTADNGYHLVHFLVPAQNARLVLYVWLDRVLGNLAITQRRLHSIAEEIAAD